MMRRIQRTGSSESLAAQNFHIQRAFQRLRGKLQLGIKGYKWVNIEVPNELWGAASLAIKLTSNGSSKFARAATIANALAPTFTDPTPAEDYYPKSITEALDYSPKLTILEDTACFVFSVLLSVFYYSRTAPATFSIIYALSLAALCFSTLALSRSWLLERHYKAVQRSERDLASPDSIFLDVNGVSLHYKKSLGKKSLGTSRKDDETSSTVVAAATARAETFPDVAIHCLHGFGASLYSWSMVQNQIAAACNALVTSSDMPGFGLSQRPSWAKAYSLGFNGTAASHILDAELDKIMNKTAAIGHTNNNNEEDTSADTTAPSSLPSSHSRTRLKKVLIGHSMGGASAAEGVIRNPEDISALVLVAPAIVAFWTGVPEAAKRQGPVAAGVALAEELVGADDFLGEIPIPSEESTEEEMNTSDRPSAGKNTSPPPRHQQHQNHRSLGRVAAAVFHAITSEIFRFILILATPFMVLLLRKLIRTRSFWERGLSSAWYDKTKISRQYIDAYRMGQLVRGWEYGILRFMAARFSEKGLFHAIASALDGDGHLSQAERLAVVCRENNIKILIIHGSNDVLVPLANSKRLSKVLPDATFVEIPNCGHMPQEEQSERFTREVQNFINNL